MGIFRSDGTSNTREEYLAGRILRRYFRIPGELECGFLCLIIYTKLIISLLYENKFCIYKVIYIT